MNASAQRSAADIAAAIEINYADLRSAIGEAAAFQELLVAAYDNEDVSKGARDTRWGRVVDSAVWGMRRTLTRLREDAEQFEQALEKDLRRLKSAADD